MIFGRWAHVAAVAEPTDQLARNAPAEEGWGWPGNSINPHYFEEGARTSICSGWVFNGFRATTDRPQGNVACTKCLDRLHNRSDRLSR